MKSAIVWILVAVALAAGAPAAAGWFLARDADARVDELLEKAPFLTVAKHSYHRGWFISDETITFELGKGMPLPPVGAANGGAREPLQVTVHNTIHHGPVPAFAGIGLARIDTAIVPPPVSQPPAPAAEPLPPLTIQTTLGLFGDATTEIRQAQIKDRPLAGDWRVAADAVEFTIHRGRHADTLEIQGKAPHVLLTRDNGVSIELTGLQASIHSKRALRSIYTGDSELTMGDFEIRVPAGDGKATRTADAPAADDPSAAGAGAGDFSLRALRATFHSEAAGEFVNNYGVVTASYAGAGDYHVQGLKVDGGVEHLQMDAFDRVATGMRAIQRAHSGQPSGQGAAIQELWKTDGVDLLVNDPVLVIHDIEAATKDGFVKLSGSARLKGATRADFKPAVDVRALLSKLEIELNIAADEPFAQKLMSARGSANGKHPAEPSLQSLLAQGYLAEANGRVSTSIRFAGGALTVNGKPFGPAVTRGTATPQL